MHKILFENKINKISDVFTNMLCEGVSNLISKYDKKEPILSYIEGIIQIFNISFNIDIKKNVVTKRDDVLVLFINYEHSVLKYCWEIYLVGRSCRIYYAGTLVYYGEVYR